MSQKNDRKVFVVDTSVLLYDKNCFDNFQGNDIILPLIVLEELDKFKTREGILGENARYVNRLLDNYREFGSLHDGVHIEEKSISVKVELNQKWDNIQSLDKKLNLEDIARGIGVENSELIDEIESIVESGTKLNLHHIISDFVN